MSLYLAGRFGQAAIVLLAAFTASFVLLQALPADAILIKFMNPDLGLSPEQIADIHASYGAEKSILSQYLHSLGNFLMGNLGFSVQAGVPVLDLLATHLPVTLKLSAIGFAIAVIVACVIAFLSVFSPFSWLRGVFNSLPALFISVPVFWLGIMLIQLFSFRLRMVSVINPGPWEMLILPVATLAVPISAPIAQILMRNIDEVMTQPFVDVARAKGASRSWVIWRHVLCNTVLPTLTIAGILLGELLAGAVITETVFGLNGVGVLTYQAVSSQDTAVLQAVVVLSAAVFAVVTLLVDLISPLVDPRLRSKKGART